MLGTIKKISLLGKSIIKIIIKWNEITGCLAFVKKRNSHIELFIFTERTPCDPIKTFIPQQCDIISVFFFFLLLNPLFCLFIFPELRRFTAILRGFKFQYRVTLCGTCISFCLESFYTTHSSITLFFSNFCSFMLLTFEWRIFSTFYFLRGFHFESSIISSSRKNMSSKKLQRWNQN